MNCAHYILQRPKEPSVLFIVETRSVFENNASVLFLGLLTDKLVVLEAVFVRSKALPLCLDGSVFHCFIQVEGR